LKVHEITKKYDLGIVTLPKTNTEIKKHTGHKLSEYPLIENLRACCNQLTYMQEGPNWYFQDYEIEQQIWFYNMLMEMDFLCVHNKMDKKYYEGITNKECRLMPTLMIEDLIKDMPAVERSGVMIGGNFCSWYGGFDSYMVAQEFDCPITIPSMGRRIQGEEHMDNLTHLPYMDWAKWIHTLNKFKYGIHLMRTHAAGTFALNCAYLGIPCIGFEGLDTQDLCHPDCTVGLGDITKAKQIAKKLRIDEEFYLYCSNIAKKNYNKYFTEEIFLTKWKSYDTN
jgi:hypothetical protein